LTQRHIMYVCAECADSDPEACGHYDRRELAVMPDGRWLCENCASEACEDGDARYANLPCPPEYGPIA